LNDVQGIRQKLGERKRASWSGPRGSDPRLQHEVLPLRSEDAIGPEGQGNPATNHQHHLKNKPEWFSRRIRLWAGAGSGGQSGRLICESLITCEYLDEAYRRRSFPDDPYERACQRMILELFSKVPSLVVSFARTTKKEDHPGIKEELRKELSKLEKVPILLAFTIINVISTYILSFPSSFRCSPHSGFLIIRNSTKCVAHTPQLKLWMAAMKKDPIVSSDLIDAKTFRGFISLYQQGSHEAYDYGL
ncbi:hypothetical protein U0070_010931, partial [Myodes glareolus]